MERQVPGCHAFSESKKLTREELLTQTVTMAKITIDQFEWKFVAVITKILNGNRWLKNIFYCRTVSTICYDLQLNFLFLFSDFGFLRNLALHQCVRNKTLNYDPYSVPLTCVPGGYYNRTKGYRKIPGDMCLAGNDKNYLPDLLPCPLK